MCCVPVWSRRASALPRASLRSPWSAEALSTGFSDVGTSAAIEVVVLYSVVLEFLSFVLPYIYNLVAGIAYVHDDNMQGQHRLILYIL